MTCLCLPAWPQILGRADLRKLIRVQLARMPPGSTILTHQDMGGYAKVGWDINRALLRMMQACCTHMMQACSKGCGATRAAGNRGHTLCNGCSAPSEPVPLLLPLPLSLTCRSATHWSSLVRYHHTSQHTSHLAA